MWLILLSHDPRDYWVYEIPQTDISLPLIVHLYCTSGIVYNPSGNVVVYIGKMKLAITPIPGVLEPRLAKPSTSTLFSWIWVVIIYLSIQRFWCCIVWSINIWKIVNEISSHLSAPLHITGATGCFCIILFHAFPLSWIANNYVENIAYVIDKPQQIDQSVASVHKQCLLDQNACIYCSKMITNYGTTSPRINEDRGCSGHNCFAHILML